jgi:hypothetical protein
VVKLWQSVGRLSIFLARVFPRLPLEANGPRMLRYWGRPVGDEENTAQKTPTHFNMALLALVPGQCLASRNNESLAGIWVLLAGPLYGAESQPRAPAASARAPGKFGTSCDEDEQAERFAARHRARTIYAFTGEREISSRFGADAARGRLARSGRR